MLLGQLEGHGPQRRVAAAIAQREAASASRCGVAQISTRHRRGASLRGLMPPSLLLLLLVASSLLSTPACAGESSLSGNTCAAAAAAPAAAPSHPSPLRGGCPCGGLEIAGG
eukprot:366031-Chlamydomonas_euryale.AAC.2